MSGAHLRTSLPVLLALLGGFPALAAEGVAWRTDVNTAAREAAESGRPMLMKFTADWCKYCHKMERTTYQDPAVAGRVNTDFVPVKVDSDKHEDLTKALGIRALPTTVIVSSDMKVIRRIAGYKTADVLTAELDEVIPAGGVSMRVAETARPTRPATPPAAARPAIAPLPEPANSLAFGGYCLVTLREDRRLELGDPAITTTYRNKTICFKSDRARREFEKNRVYFWPVWDGNCPVTAIETRRPSEGVPATAAIYRDRLWFFADRPHRERFDETPTDYLPSVAARAGATSRN